MQTPKLQHFLANICKKLTQAEVPHALIGAMALAVYGIPRYTADIDLLSDTLCREKLTAAMGALGYQCYHQSDIFSQFDSTDGILGRVDYLLVHTDEGRAILNRSIMIEDELLGSVRVVQPTDYAVLKLMAIANNKERRVHDSADLSTLINAHAAGIIHKAFTPLDFQIVENFAKRFHVSKLLNSLRT